MQIHILASGSTGNTAFFQFGQTKLLVDAGISTRRIENKLAAIGVGAEELDGVLITHEHVDHIKGLDVFIRRYQLPVYARAATWQAIPCRHKLPPQCCITIGQHFQVGEVEIQAHRISHDAADPVGFSFRYRNKKWVMATDMGVITRDILNALIGADLVVLESNHDLEMLEKGPYPAFLKHRIMGKLGHLSNHDAASVLARIPRRDKMQVFLAHLSQQNNDPDLAMKTVCDSLSKQGCRPGRDIGLRLACPDSTISYSG